MLFSFITLPTATDTLAQLGAYSSPMFSELLPIALVVCGCLIGGLIALFLINSFLGLFDKMSFKRQIDRDFKTMSVEELDKKYNKD